MLATGMSEPGVARHVSWREGGNPLAVLPVSGVFGANASGKTGLLKAMDDMRGHVLRSFRASSPTAGLRRRPFLLDTSARKAPSRFAIDLVLRGVRHEYGFVINDERVLEEWAYYYPKGRSATLFHREELAVEVGATERSKGRAVAELLRPNSLFLSTAAAVNHQALLPLYSWFERNLLLAEAGSRVLRQALTVNLLDGPADRERVLEMLRAADLGISGAKELRPELDPAVKEHLQKALRILAGEDSEAAGEDLPMYVQSQLRLTHHGSDGDVDLDSEEESLGTLVWFGLVGLVVQALANGTVLLVDELDASLHPALVAQLVGLFQRPETNPRRAQLIFNSHDATLLGDSVSDRVVGRDQVWFTEKRTDGSSRLYPLADLDPRKEEAIGRRYLAGRYGAKPILSQQQFTAVAELITSGDDS